MQIKIKKLHPDATMPAYATDGAAAFDLTAVSVEYDILGGVITYHTGLAFEIPRGCVGLLFPRSSICNVDMRLTNCVGVIDSDYRGEVMAKFKTDTLLNRNAKIYKKGDRIIQMIIMPAPQVELIEVDELSETERGSGGFGSTGK